MNLRKTHHITILVSLVSMQTNMKNMADSGLIQEQKKELLDRASAFPVNSTAETSGGTHGSHMYKLFFSPLQRAKRNSMVK